MTTSTSTKRVLMPAALSMALGLSLSLGLAACASDGGTSGGSPTSSTSTQSSVSKSPQSAESNSADVMFATMMMPHHQQAIDMCDMLLAKDGVDPKVTALAQDIKDAQGPEIELMNSWLVAWGAPTVGPDNPGGMSGMDHGSMGGMMSEADMNALKDATGPVASTLFLEQMIQHHEGAIAMAKTELQQGQNPDALALAQQIVDAQTAEIATMKELLTAKK